MNHQVMTRAGNIELFAKFGQEPAAGRPLKPGKAVKLWVAPATQSVPTRVPTTHVP